MIRKLLEYPAYGFNLARFLHFKSQNDIFNLLFSRLPWVDREMLKPNESTALLKMLSKELRDLLRQDAQNIAEGIYPLKVLKPEFPLEHFKRIPWILWEGLKIYNRRVKKIHRSFSRRASNLLKEMPEYFRRNYHFQTDGYLSESSAELYDHQVELLFSGAGDAMRRILLRPLKERIGEGEGLRFLELACGTGRMTRFVKLTFPAARIVASDLSVPYISVAKKKIGTLARVDFMQADASKTPFKDESFDVIYSVFLFHELPPEVRMNVIQEGFRVLKSGGLFAFVDSVQIKDFEEGREALEHFPLDFHEPFYKSYIENPIEDLLEKTGFQFVKTTRGFLSKAVIAQKPAR